MGARWVHLALALAVVVGVFVQVYLIGAYIFGAGQGALDAHMTAGWTVHGFELLVFLAALVAWLPWVDLVLSLLLAVVGNGAGVSRERAPLGRRSAPAARARRARPRRNARAARTPGTTRRTFPAEQLMPTDAQTSPGAGAWLSSSSCRGGGAPEGRPRTRSRPGATGLRGGGGRLVTPFLLRVRARAREGGGRPSGATQPGPAPPISYAGVGVPSLIPSYAWRACAWRLRGSPGRGRWTSWSACFTPCGVSDGCERRAPVRAALNAGQRSDLNAARSSEANRSGSSHAAKWPPLSTLLK